MALFSKETQHSFALIGQTAGMGIKLSSPLPEDSGTYLPSAHSLKQALGSKRNTPGLFPSPRPWETTRWGRGHPEDCFRGQPAARKDTWVLGALSSPRGPPQAQGRGLTLGTLSSPSPAWAEGTLKWSRRQSHRQG